jgi:CPA1 family monovalent cation:H+ antiporter
MLSELSPETKANRMLIMITQTLGQVLALGGLTLIGLLINRLLRIELTLSCLIIGFLFGLGITYIDFDTGIRAHNLRDIVFYLILPVLIFEAAWQIQPKVLTRWLLPILLLATFGVLLSMGISASLVYFGINHPDGFPLIAALLVGAILAASDPIAVIGQLKQLNAPHDLTTLFEGESLFNDATAIVLFTIVLGIATQMPLEGRSYIGFFSLVFFGGLGFGLLLGLITTGLIMMIGMASASRFILVFSAFSSFYIAEYYLHVSGIMSVMMAAIVTRFSLQKFENTTIHGVSETWEWLGLFLNTILFVIMGLVITVDMFYEQWLAMIIAIIASLVARFLSVKASSLLSRLLGKPIPDKWQLLLVWGGLRGAVAIALVLSLPTSLPYWWIVQSMVFGVVIFSLLIQGTSNKWLMKSLLKEK